MLNQFVTVFWTFCFPELPTFARGFYKLDLTTVFFILLLASPHSLALVLPKYSEHFIQAKLGDDMQQVMCEYSHHIDI